MDGNIAGRRTRAGGISGGGGIDGRNDLGEATTGNPIVDRDIWPD